MTESAHPKEEYVCPTSWRRRCGQLLGRVARTLATLLPDRTDYDAAFASLTNELAPLPERTLDEQHTWLHERFTTEFGPEVTEDTTQGIGRMLNNLSQPSRDARYRPLPYRTTILGLELDVAQPDKTNEMLAKLSHALQLDEPLTVTGIQHEVFSIQAQSVTDPHSPNPSLVYEVINESRPHQGVYADEIARSATAPTLIVKRRTKDDVSPEVLALPIPQCPGAVLRISGWGTFASPELDYLTNDPKRPMLIGLSLQAPLGEVVN